jgi:hypothetical protein
MDYTGVNGSHNQVSGHSPFFQLGSDQAVGQTRRIDRAFQLRQDERQGSNVVFVPVGDENSPDFIEPFQQVGDVGDYQVHPKHSFFRELDPAVDDYDIVFVLQGHHVFADFPKSAQGNYA